MIQQANKIYFNIMLIFQKLLEIFQEIKILP
jgi:hypothetical protein